MIKRRPREFWQGLFDEVEAGTGVTAVARRHAVKARTLGWWCWQLRRDRETRAAPRLLPVVVTSPAEVVVTSPASSTRVEVVTGDVIVRLVGDVDFAQVAALVFALRRAC